MSEWNFKERRFYVLTEFIFFLIIAITVLTCLTLACIVASCNKLLNKALKTTVIFRLLFENVLPSAIALAPETERKTDDANKNEMPINVVFLGHRERKRSVRPWIYAYFIFLWGFILILSVSVFSDSLLYRKISSCTDTNLHDTDLSCFPLHNKGDIPNDIQDIINEEEGELVPCNEVNGYILANNLTFDLEVICYQY